MGLFFTLSVFTTYLLIGLGLFKTIRIASSFSIISIIIRWILIAVLFTFAAISIYDYFLIRSGRQKDIILKLPSFIKKQIQKTIKTHVRSTALIVSAVVLGFLVSLFELACTGQVYFPTIVYLVQIKKEITAYMFLIIYNVGFIIPLLTVFILTYRGVNSKKFTNLFQQNMGKVKIGLAVIFLSLIVLTVIT